MNQQMMQKFRKNLPAGEILMEEGFPGRELFILEKGTLDVYIVERQVGSISAEGGPEFVGEVAAILGTNRTATVKAASDIQVLQVPKVEIQALITSSPALGVRLIESLCKKITKGAEAVVEEESRKTRMRKSRSVETSIKAYLKGLLFLMELARENPSSETVNQLHDYFLRTNPWAVQHGKKEALDLEALDWEEEEAAASE